VTAFSEARVARVGDRWHALARPLHPLAWWGWAAGLAVAASATTNPLVSLEVVGVAALVVAARRPDAPWGASFGAFCRVGVVLLGLQVALAVVFGASGSGPVLVTLPHLALPAWAAGVRVGGPVSADVLLGSLYDGLRLVAILACVGAANSLASPARLLRCLPAALYEVGVAVVVAVSLAPQLVGEAARVRQGRRLRGRRTRGARALGAVALGVLTGALDRSLALAAAMDSRGYGRSGGASRRRQQVTGAAVLTGLVGAAIGSYGLVAGTGTALPTRPGVSLALVIAGGLAAGGGLLVGGRRVRRTRYRPDPWAAPEWAVVAVGALAAIGVALAARADPAALASASDPLAWPALPAVAVAAVGCAAAAALLAPPLPTSDSAGRSS